MLNVSGCHVMVTEAESVFLIVYEELLELLIYITHYRFCFYFPGICHMCKSQWDSHCLIVECFVLINWFIRAL